MTLLILVFKGLKQRAITPFVHNLVPYVAEAQMDSGVRNVFNFQLLLSAKWRSNFWSATGITPGRPSGTT